jgi:hypothetical protein
MRLPALTTSKMPKETEQQYIAWLLYCEVGSIPKLRKAWEQVRLHDGGMTGIWGQKLQKSGLLPIERTLERWSSKYRWVERQELKLKQEMEEVNERLSKIIQKKKYEIVILFGEALEKYGRQLRDPNRIVTVQEVRILWEMMRIELGEPVGNYQGNPNAMMEIEQIPPAPNDELDEVIEEAAVAFYRRRRVKHV